MYNSPPGHRGGEQSPNELHVMKASVVWIQRLLTPDQKLLRYTMPRDNLSRFETDADKLINGFAISWLRFGGN